MVVDLMGMITIPKATQTETLLDPIPTGMTTLGLVAYLFAFTCYQFAEYIVASVLSTYAVT